MPKILELQILPTSPEQSDAFRRAVNRAMSAAELTQVADSQEEWQTVVTWWQDAVDLMKTVPFNSKNHAIAQTKVQEYQNNLNYAQGQLQRSNASTASDQLWAVGSLREQVLQVQGEPMRSVQYDSLCQEVLYYGNSIVELTNGTVSTFRDSDGKFRVSAQPPDARLTVSSSSYWTLGTEKEDVFRIQGTPNRVEQQSVSEQETLYYGNSTITINDDKVIGYSNLDNNLRISVEAIATPPSDTIAALWSLGSGRDEVFRIQGTPTQVFSDGSLCGEILYYGSSTIELRNGTVSAYNNSANNLKVTVK